MMARFGAPAARASVADAVARVLVGGRRFLQMLVAPCVSAAVLGRPGGVLRIFRV